MPRWKYWGNELRRPELSPLAPEFLFVVPRSDLWVAEDWEMPVVELLRQNEARLDKPAILHSKQLRTFLPVTSQMLYDLKNSFTRKFNDKFLMIQAVSYTNW